MLLTLLAGCLHQPPEPAAPPAGQNALLQPAVFTRPARYCPEPPPAIPPPPLPPADAAPLAVKRTKTGFSLESDGALAGRVLAALGAAADIPVLAEGWGAQVRIYAHVPDASAEALFASIAAATGLRTQRSPVSVLEESAGSILRFADPWTLEEEARARAAATESTSYRSLLVIPVHDPLALAPILATTALGCRGRVIPLPAQGYVLIEDTDNALEQARALIAAVDVEDPSSARVELPADQLGPRGFFEPEPAPCPWTAQAAPIAPAGRLLLDAARRESEGVIVGCGGDKPAWGRLPPGASPSDLADQLGLLSSSGSTALADALLPEGLHIVATREVFQRAALRRLHCWEPASLYVAALPAADPATAAPIVREGLGLDAWPYRGVLLVAGYEDGLAQARAFLEAVGEIQPSP